ncbi:hypothetical protein RhiJN_11465 [Ceratobasidium sp. AG-Ba]|nr:hypothetical protein RhiJN_11465 [Ceratobasidium sp. AG-Ba]QRW12183.1 hypothetical protein RhiLY_11182 [Ceratobasidium sp. AG-Ba]
MSLSTTHHRRTSIPIPPRRTSTPVPPRHTRRHPSPPPTRVTSAGRTSWPRHNEPGPSHGHYTLAWQSESDDEYRRPRARTVAAVGPDVEARASRAARPRSHHPFSPSAALDLCQPCSASRAWLASGSRKDRRKQSQRTRPKGVVRRDSGYESDDADEDTTTEDLHDTYAGRADSPVRMTAPHAPHLSSSPSGRPSSAHTSLLRPDSPSNESSASTDDDYYSSTPANADPYALEYYLGNDDTWRDAEIYSQSSDESGYSADERAIDRRLNEFATGSSHLPSDMGACHRHTQSRRPRRPRMPKRIPLVPTCSKSRKRASMRAAWKMRFGRLFESDSEAGTEVEDELDWEGYESADARRIVAIRIHKAGGGDGRKVMQGGPKLAELLVKQPLDPKRLARRTRARGDTVTGAPSRPEPEPEDTCPTCATPLTSTTSPTASESASLPTPSTPPTSVPSTPCASCAHLSPRGDVAGLPSPTSRRKVLSPRSPPCKTTPLHAGTDPLTVFAVTVEQEKQRDFSGLLKRSAAAAPSSSMLSGLVRGVKSWIGRINTLVDIAASAPLTTVAVDGTCPLSPFMGGIARAEVNHRRRAASAPPTPTPLTAPASPRTPHRRRRSLARALPGAPTSPYGYRVRPQEVSVAFPVLVDEHVVAESVNVAATTIPMELQDVIARPMAEPEPVVAAPTIELKAPPEGKRKRASRSRSRSPSGRKDPKKTLARAAEMEANRDELTRSRAVVDSKYWRVLAGEMEQRRRGGVEIAFMVRLAVEEGRNLPIFTSEEQQAATGEIVVGGVWKASLARWRVGGVGKGHTRIRSGLINELYSGEGSDVVSDSSSSMM